MIRTKYIFNKSLLLSLIILIIFLIYVDINIPKVRLVEAHIAQSEISSQEIPQKKEILLDIIEDKKEKSVQFILKSDNKIKEYNSFTLFKPNRIVVDLSNTKTISNILSIPIEDDQIKEIRIGKHPNKLRCVFEVNQEETPDFDIERFGEDLVLTVKRPTHLAKVKKVAKKEIKKEVVKKEVKEKKPEVKIELKENAETVHGMGNVKKKVEGLAVIPTKEEKKVKEKLYTLSFRKADIYDILTVLSRENKLNIIIDPDVKGNVTVDLKEVTLSNVLDVILTPLNLQYKMKDNFIRVSPVKMQTRVFTLNYLATKRI